MQSGLGLSIITSLIIQNNCHRISWPKLRDQLRTQQSQSIQGNFHTSLMVLRTHLPHLMLEMQQAMLEEAMVRSMELTMGIRHMKEIQSVGLGESYSTDSLL